MLNFLSSCFVDPPSITIAMKFFVSTALASVVAVSAAPSLFLNVTVPSSVVDIHGLSVKATLKNTGDETLKLLNDPSTVLSTARTDTFSISSESGSPDFTGIKLKYVPSLDAALNEEGTFTVLAPGQSVEITHDLAGVYDFTKAGEGAYKFSAANHFHYVGTTGALKRIKARTHTRLFRVAGKLAAALERKPIGVGYTGCSAEQQTIILAAAIASNNYVAAASAYLPGITANAPTDRYTTWFGEFTNERHKAVVDHFQKIGTDATSTNYDCASCAIEQGLSSHSLFAYVEPDVPGKIYLCDAFWRAPLIGEDSRAGTIVHENSHFTVNGGTRDWVYGQPKCQELAQDNPDEAIQNADSHEYL
ncbi:hypothetical protein FRC10_007258 [Ceratobasidium sp. 414]|nr:hypothetical protein FRC10_007258 [Ceratobasidium sp. 414]